MSNLAKWLDALFCRLLGWVVDRLPGEDQPSRPGSKAFFSKDEINAFYNLAHDSLLGDRNPQGKCPICAKLGIRAAFYGRDDDGKLLLISDRQTQTIIATVYSPEGIVKSSLPFDMQKTLIDHIKSIIESSQLKIYARIMGAGAEF